MLCLRLAKRVRGPDLCLPPVTGCRAPRARPRSTRCRGDLSPPWGHSGISMTQLSRQGVATRYNPPGAPGHFIITLDHQCSRGVINRPFCRGTNIPSYIESCFFDHAAWPVHWSCLGKGVSLPHCKIALEFHPSVPIRGHNSISYSLLGRRRPVIPAGGRSLPPSFLPSNPGRS